LISKSKGWFLKKTLLLIKQGFSLFLCFYELTQIIINNSDIILVKHYFIERVGNFSGINRQGLFCRLDVCDVIALGIQLKRDGKKLSLF
jgi:hypothetical protein